MKYWDELDAFTPWRRYYHWKPGELKRIKRRYNKRMRRLAKIDPTWAFWDNELDAVYDGM